MKKKVVWGMTALLTVSLAACKQYDITQNFSNDTHYADDFIEEFGDPDPLQDWSMATQIEIEAQVALDEYEGGDLRVYTSDPYSANARILGTHRIDNEFIRFTIEAPKQLNVLYVAVKSPIGYMQYKPAEIVNGICKVQFGIYDTKSNARGNFNTNATDEVKYWEGNVPEGQYEQVVPTDAVTVEGTVSYIDNNTFQGKQNIHLHNAEINNMNFWIGNLNIYVSGHVTVERWYTASNTNVYVCAGAELNLPGVSSLGQDKTTWTICEDAKITFANDVEFAYGQTVYNRGSISAASFNFSNNSLVYNDGGLETTGNIKVANGSANLINKGVIHGANLELIGSLYNEGDIKCNGSVRITTNWGEAASTLYNRGSLSGNNGLSVEGSSIFINDYMGETEITGMTTVNSNECTWHNKGHYRTSDLKFNATSKNWLNECYLKIDNHLEIILGGSPNLPVNNSYIETGTMYMDNGGMKLGPNSQLIVNNTAKFGYNVYNQWNTSCGLQSTATGNEWSVFKAKKIAQERYNQGFTISYVGNLIIDCYDHFSQGYSDKSQEQQEAGEIGSQPYINLVGSAKMAPGGDNYSIPGSDCSEPYNAEVPTPPAENPQYWIMACEDLGGTFDYDFNDVVFSVSHTNGDNYATVQPLAAGGSLASILYYKNVPINGDVLNSEIHYMLGYTGTTISGSYNMLNTGRGRSTEYTASPVKIFLDNPNASIEEIAGLISVHVIAKDGDIATDDYNVSRIVNRPVSGAAPQVIILPDSWIWPIEKVGIKKAYPGFENWVKDATTADWANSAVNSNLVKDYSK